MIKCGCFLLFIKLFMEGKYCCNRILRNITKGQIKRADVEILYFGGVLKWPVFVLANKHYGGNSMLCVQF